MSSMPSRPKVLYEFGPFRVDPDKQVLLRENQPISLTPKTFETLLILIRRNREDVSKDVLMNELWPDSFVEESNLKQNIFLLRKALGDTPDDKRYIITLPGKGYRFAGEVRTITQDGDDVIIGSHSRSDVVVNHTGAPPVITVPALAVQKRRKLNWKYASASRCHWCGPLRRAVQPRNPVCGGTSSTSRCRLSRPAAMQCGHGHHMR